MLFILRHIATDKRIETASILEAASILKVPLMSLLSGKVFEYDGWKCTRIDEVDKGEVRA